MQIKGLQLQELNIVIDILIEEVSGNSFWFYPGFIWI